MQILKQGDYKLKDWSLETECTGIGHTNKHKPCHSTIKLEDGDIVKLHQKEPMGYGVFKYWLSYGFICCECHCFTEIPAHLIPSEIREHCLTVAQKGSDEYSDLSEKEKELSENL